MNSSESSKLVMGLLHRGEESSIEGLIKVEAGGGGVCCHIMLAKMLVWSPGVKSAAIVTEGEHSLILGVEV